MIIAEDVFFGGGGGVGGLVGSKGTVGSAALHHCKWKQ